MIAHDYSLQFLFPYYL